MSQSNSGKAPIYIAIITGVFALLVAIVEKDRLWDFLLSSPKPESMQSDTTSTNSHRYNAKEKGNNSSSKHTRETNTSPFLGTWYNQDALSNNITKITITSASNGLKVAMEKRHPPTDMGEHSTTVINDKISLDITMTNIGIRFQPVLKIAAGKLVMEMTQLRNGVKFTNYKEEFARTKPVSTPPVEPTPDGGKTVQDFTGIWVNKNEHSDNIESLTIENIDASRVRVTMVKVHPEKNLGTHIATLENNKIRLNFEAAGYRWEPSIFFQNGTLAILMKQTVQGGDTPVFYTEYFRN